MWFFDLSKRLPKVVQGNYSDCEGEVFYVFYKSKQHVYDGIKNVKNDIRCNCSNDSFSKFKQGGRYFLKTNKMNLYLPRIVNFIYRLFKSDKRWLTKLEQSKKEAKKFPIYAILYQGYYLRNREDILKFVQIPIVF